MDILIKSLSVSHRNIFQNCARTAFIFPVEDISSLFSNHEKYVRGHIFDFSFLETQSTKYKIQLKQWYDPEGHTRLSLSLSSISFLNYYYFNASPFKFFEDRSSGLYRQIKIKWHFHLGLKNNIQTGSLCWYYLNRIYQASLKITSLESFLLF